MDEFYLLRIIVVILIACRHIVVFSDKYPLQSARTVLERKYPVLSERQQNSIRILIIIECVDVGPVYAVFDFDTAETVCGAVLVVYIIRRIKNQLFESRVVFRVAVYALPYPLLSIKTTG